ncbi:hypothetical protein MNV49_000485 [Pseudohyphozyma bogoriensis]|nr:hypothetical protein MNV49_000485 [Pseudohyphozyma bogoriensis]
MAPRQSHSFALSFLALSALLSTAAASAVSTSVFPNAACAGSSSTSGGLVGIGQVAVSGGGFEAHCGCLADKLPGFVACPTSEAGESVCNSILDLDSGSFTAECGIISCEGSACPTTVVNTVVVDDTDCFTSGKGNLGYSTIDGVSHCACSSEGDDSFVTCPSVANGRPSCVSTDSDFLGMTRDAHETVQCGIVCDEGFYLTPGGSCTKNIKRADPAGASGTFNTGPIKIGASQAHAASSASTTASEGTFTTGPIKVITTTAAATTSTGHHHHHHHTHKHSSETETSIHLTGVTKLAPTTTSTSTHHYGSHRPHHGHHAHSSSSSETETSIHLTGVTKVVTVTVTADPTSTSTHHHHHTTHKHHHHSSSSETDTSISLGGVTKVFPTTTYSTSSYGSHRHHHTSNTHNHAAHTTSQTASPTTIVLTGVTKIIPTTTAAPSTTNALSSALSSRLSHASGIRSHSHHHSHSHSSSSTETFISLTGVTKIAPTTTTTSSGAASTSASTSTTTKTGPSAVFGGGPIKIGASQAAKMIKRVVQETAQETFEADLCAADERKCPASAFGDYSCVRLDDVEECGGCRSLGESQNCLDIPGVATAACLRGGCVVRSCKAGFIQTSDSECSAKE